MKRLARWLLQLLRAVTRPWRMELAVRRILRGTYGHARSVRQAEPVDRDGGPIPWFTYPAIEYFAQWDLSHKAVFEFGAGNSTIFWGQRAARVVSVENNRAWHERVRPRLAPNVELHLVEEPTRYAGRLTECSGRFDVIVVDGIARRACCSAALAKLQPGGVIILDNSDWHHLCAALLRDAGLLEVDFTGFGPINGYTWTTSFFFRRDFAFPGKHDRQPVHGLGSLPHREDEA